MSILSKIQTELKAPKNQYNSFGKYKYRSLEDILEGLKPLLDKYTASLVMTDEIVLVGDRYYIKASASLYDETMKEVGSAFAFARESLSAKGQSDAQITGAASSYARKYCLNGLFSIDDTKDADSADNSHSEKPVNNSLVSASQVKLIQTRLSKLEDKEANETALKAHYKIDSWNDLPANAMTGLIDWFEKKGI